MNLKLTVPLAILLALAATLAGLQVAINRERVSDVTVLNPEGAAGTALVVYHPGLSDLQQKLTRSFADGLVSNGWRVEITTTSQEAPTDLSDYDLLTLGVHTYWFAPDRPTRQYLKRLDDLNGKPTAALLTGLGSTGRAENRTEAFIREANGEVIDVMPFWVLRPNDEEDPRPNGEVALEMANEAGRNIAAEQ